MTQLLILPGRDDFSEVKAALISEAYNWEQIGCALGLSQTILKRIHRDYSTDQSEALSQVIILWLSMVYSVQSFGKPSWYILVRVMAHETGGNNKNKAEEIARKHPKLECEVQPHPVSPPAGDYNQIIVQNTE